MLSSIASRRRRRVRASRLWSETGPCPFVVRSSSGSWMTTISPSLLRWRSNSTASTSSSAVLRKPSRLFSAHRLLAPRWAMILIMVLFAPLLRRSRRRFRCAARIRLGPAPRPGLFAAVYQAFHEPSLSHEHDDDRRRHRHQRGTHQKVPGRRRIRRRHEVAQPDDSCRHVLVRRDEEWPKVLVPRPQEQDDRHREDVGPREREKDRPEKLHWT